MMNTSQVCGNCRTWFKDEDDRFTTIAPASKNNIKFNELNCKTVSINEALLIVFEMPPLIPNTAQDDHVHEDEVARKMQMFRERSKFAARLQRDYAVCTDCSKLLTELYDAMQNFTAACNLESEIGKVLKEIHENAHRNPVFSQVTAEQAKNQETEGAVKTEPVESENEDANDDSDSYFKSNGALSPVKLPLLGGDSGNEDDIFNHSEPASPQSPEVESNTRYIQDNSKNSTNEVTHGVTLRPRRNIAKTINASYTYNDTDCADSDEENENRTINNLNRKRWHRKRKKQDSDEEFIPEYENGENKSPKNTNLSPVASTQNKEKLALHNLNLTCPKCGKHFLHESTLICHRRIVHREKVVIPVPEPLSLRVSAKKINAESSKSCDKMSTCLICREEVPRNEIRSHTSLHVRSLTKPWLCTICGKDCTSQENLFEHSRFHKLSIPCKRCGKKVPRLEMLVHVRACLKVAATGNFSCKHCDQTFKSSLQLMEHRSLVHGHVWKCKLCESKFSRRVQMVEHMLSHRKKKAFKCKICEKTFDRNDVRRLHVKRFHLNDAPPSVLRSSALETGDDCDVGVISESELPDPDGKDTNASDLPSKDPKYTCKSCDLSFQTQTAVESHMSVHTDPATTKCTICNRAFQDNYCLTLHMRNHYEKKPMLCCVCQKHYRDKNSLFYHLKDTHAFENQEIVNAYPEDFRSLAKNPLKPLPKRKKRALKRPQERGEFPCDTCGKVFPYMHSVTSHIKTVHDQIKDFICSYCGKAFAKKAYFVLHERLHTTTDAPYKCHLCGKGFRLPGNLRQHLKSTIHNPTRDYICEICGKGFNRADNMKLHVKAVHMKIQIRKPRNHGESSSKGRRRIGNESFKIRKSEVASLLQHASSSSQSTGERIQESGAFNHSALKQETTSWSAINSPTGQHSENESVQQHHSNLSMSALYQGSLAERGHNQFDSLAHANYAATIQPSPYGMNLRGFQYR